MLFLSTAKISNYIFTNFKTIKFHVPQQRNKGKHIILCIMCIMYTFIEIMKELMTIENEPMAIENELMAIENELIDKENELMFIEI